MGHETWQWYFSCLGQFQIRLTAPITHHQLSHEHACTFTVAWDILTFYTYLRKVANRSNLKCPYVVAIIICTGIALQCMVRLLSHKQSCRLVIISPNFEVKLSDCILVDICARLVINQLCWMHLQAACIAKWFSMPICVFIL